MAEGGQARKGQGKDAMVRATTGIGDESDTARIMFEAGVVQRSRIGTVAGSRVVAHRRCSEGGMSRPPSKWSTVAGVRWNVTRGPCGPVASCLIGHLAVDGDVETGCLGLGLDPDTEEDIDDLDDHERPDDGIPDRGADGDQLVHQLLRVAFQ